MSTTDTTIQNEDLTLDEAKAKLKEKEDTIKNLTSEIQDERQKKQDAQKAAEEALKPDPKPAAGEADVATLVATELEKRDQVRIQKEKDEALVEFRASLAEFNADNDPGDLKFNAFKRELAKFNLSDLTSKEAIKGRLKEVYDFANRSAKPQNGSIVNQFAPTPQSHHIAGGDGDGGLTKPELDLIESKGWSKEKYIGLKEKMPAFISGLLRRTTY